MRVALLLFVLEISVQGLPCEAAKRHFTVADDIGLTHFGDPYTARATAITFSPDGQYFVVDTERGLLKENRPESTLRVFRTEDVHQFLLHPETRVGPSPRWIFSKSTYQDGPIITNIRWLADSSGISFLVKTSSGKDQLFLADLKKRTMEALTPDNQHVTGFDIRDRKHFVYSAFSPKIGQRAAAESQATSVVGTGRFLGSLMFPADFSYMSQVYDLSELWAVIDGRRFRANLELSSHPVALHSEGERALALSPDGRFVVTALVTSNVPPEWETLYRSSAPSDPYRIRSGAQDPEGLDGSRYVSEYVRIDLSTGKVKALADAPLGRAAGWVGGPWTDAIWSADSESVLLPNTFLPPQAHDSGGLLSRPCVAVVDLAKWIVSCVEPLKGKAKSKSGWEDGVHFAVRGRFASGTTQRVTVDYWELDASKGSTSYVRSEGGSWVVAARAKGWTDQNNQVRLDVKESFTDPPVLLATDETTKTSRVILDPNPHLKGIALGEASVYRWKDKTGRDWVGGLYKPPDYAPGQRYPLVLQTHGFFETLFRPDGIFPTAFAARELVAVGVLVLQVPDCPFTTNPEEGACNVAGYESGVEQLVSDGLVDRDRVGIIGFSRTCYYVLEALTRGGQHFKAASITDGINFGYLEYMATIDMKGNGVPNEANRVVGASPFGEGLQQWVKRSPEFNMDKVTAPLQVVANGRLGVLFMWEPYACLRFLNKPVDMMVLRQGTHVLTNPAERMASQAGTVDWFRFWLKGEEDPDPAKAEQYTRWHELRKLQEKNENATVQSISP